MGKYMKRKGLGKIAMRELSQSSPGVRTRARALALQKHPKIAHTNKRCESLKHPCQSECKVSLNTYMELRSRRLEKVARHSTGRGDDAPQAARELEKSSPECSRPASNFDRSPDEESRLRIPNTSSSSHGRPASAVASDTSHSNTAQVSLQSSVKGSVRTGLIHRRFTRTASDRSRSVSGSHSQGRPVGTSTKNQRQEFASSISQEGMEADVNAACRMEAAPSCDNKNLEVGPFFGENSLVAGPCIRDSQVSCEQEMRRQTRDSTPNSCSRDDQAPGSTSRTRRPRRRQGRSLSAPPFARASEGPSSWEIEAFFDSAEQQERTRFMERYNFDPVNDRPLRGRYEWFSM